MSERTTNPFVANILDHIAAGFSGIYVVTAEPDDVVASIRANVSPYVFLAEWDIEQGVRIDGRVPEGGQTCQGDPEKILRQFPVLAKTLSWEPKSTDPNMDRATLESLKIEILVLHNFPMFFGNPRVVQGLHNTIRDGRGPGRYIIVLAPGVRLSPELKHDFVVLDHPLPTREDIASIASSLKPDRLPPPGRDRESILDAAIGLTRIEAENSMAKSLAQHNALVPDVIWGLKTDSLKKTGLVSLYRGKEKFADLGGLDGMKKFCRDVILSKDDHPECRPRGIMIVGNPGTGKSQFCKALGNETGRPVLVLDFGALKSKFVGDSEHNIREALKIADSMAPCVLFADEIEKALAGVGASHVGDTGVTEGMFGTLLTWLNDHTSDVFFVASANDITKLPAEFTRAERFDRIFFVELPSTEEREVIWNMYLDRYGLDRNLKRPADTQWTGGEIKSCCRVGRRLVKIARQPLLEAAEGLVPIALSSKDVIDARRERAHNTYTDAATGKVYKKPVSIDDPSANGTGSRRRIGVVGKG